MQDVLRVNCKGHIDLDIDSLVPAQGNLKTLSKESYEAFRRQIQKNGFCQPFNVCQLEGKNYIGDGHIRLLVLKGLRSDGWLVPQVLPCNLFYAQSKKEMLQILMGLASQYGEVTSDGLYELMAEAGLSLASIEDYRFPEVENERFLKEFEDQIEEESNLTPKEPKKCPNCGHKL